MLPEAQLAQALWELLASTSPTHSIGVAEATASLLGKPRPRKRKSGTPAQDSPAPTEVQPDARL
eukprot:10597475-Prorocentrum_lima.AAC.1